MGAAFALRPKSRPSLRAPGAAEVLRRLSGRFEGCVRILCGHGDGRLDVGQTTAGGSSQDRGSRRFLVRELADGHPVMVAEGQVPPDEPAASALEEFGNHLLAIFWL